MKLAGSDIFIECLVEQGVDIIFGFPGGAVLNLYDSIYKARNRIMHILTSHEQGAAHAADGYARATGKVGVCVATSGPGATNLVTGIATAYMDSVPMVAFTGQVSTSLLGKDSFQEVDITGITIPITKHNYIVKDVEKLAATIRQAFRIAREGRPGPVLVDICKDVTAAFAEYVPMAVAPAEEEPMLCSDAEIISAAEAINSSRKPFIFAGGGVSIAGAGKEVLTLAEKARIPVSNSLMGLGSFPGTHELYTGLLGMHGTRTSNSAVSEADLFIAIGARFSDRVTSNVKKFATKAKIMHIDIDPAEVNKNLSVDFALMGNIKKILRILIENVNGRSDSEWNSKISALKRDFPLKYANDGVLRPQYIIERLYELTGGDALITTEVGQNQIWAAQFYKYTAPRQFISSGGLGTMGYGLGACIGAQLGRPEKKVFNIAGDGSFRMNSNELATAVEYKLPVTIMLLDNKVLGLVRQWQDLFYGKRYSATTIDRATDFVALAKAYGADAIKVTSPDQVDAAIKLALEAKDAPLLIDFLIDKDEKVLPIVPPGASIEEIID